MKKQCKNCLYFESCQGAKRVCGSYCSTDEDLDDDTVFEMIEDERYEFYNAWNLYISEYND